MLAHLVWYFSLLWEIGALMKCRMWQFVATNYFLSLFYFFLCLPSWWVYRSWVFIQLQFTPNNCRCSLGHLGDTQKLEGHQYLNTLPRLQRFQILTVTFEVHKVKLKFSSSTREGTVPVPLISNLHSRICSNLHHSSLFLSKFSFWFEMEAVRSKTLFCSFLYTVLHLALLISRK